MKTPYTLTLFTPAEAEAITGVSNNVQRDWRRHEYLPKNDGHARFDMFDLGKLMSMKLLSDRGIGPKETHEVADWCATGIAFHCLSYSEAYEGNEDLALTWFPEMVLNRFRKQSIEALECLSEELQQKLKSDPKTAELFTKGSIWGGQSEWLAKQIVQRFRGRVLPAQYLIWWADGTHTFQHSVDAALKKTTSIDSSVTGAVVFLDLIALAGVIIENIENKGRSLVHVDFEVDPETGKAKSPMEYGAAISLDTK